MSSSWSGLYTRASVASTTVTLRQLALARGYRVLLSEWPLSPSVAQEAGHNFQRDLSGEIETGLDSVFILSLGNGWSCVHGLDELISPRLMYAHELVKFLKCDALECGFYESISWWYVLYQEGFVLDQYDQNPEESYDERTQLGTFNPTDIRETYHRSIGQKGRSVHLPPEVLLAYRGDPKKIAAVFRDLKSEQDVETILRRTEVHPETAFLQFCYTLSLPNASETSSDHLFMRLTRLASEGFAELPPDQELTRWMDDGMSMMILQH